MSQTIAMLGTGGNGSSAAADLVAAGLDVVLIDQWPAHVEAMRADGLRIRMSDRETHTAVRAYHLCDVCTLNRTFDIVLLGVKAYDTVWACEFIKPYLAPDGLLIGLQNAMTAETIAAIVGRSRTLGCVVELSSELFTPGIVQRNTPPEKTWFGVGSFDPSTTGRVEEIAALLRHVGKVSISPDVLSAKWMKLIVNTMCLAPFAIVGLSMRDALQLPGMRELFLRIGSEALAVGQRLGYGVEPIFGLRPEDLQGTNQLLEKLFDKLAGDIGGRSPRNCILQDIHKGRYSETDMINGLVADESARMGLQAPANAMVVELARRIHAGTLTPDPANLGLAWQMLDQRQREPA